ncbi:MAG: DUF4416 family protein [Planctomycetes bacterium]|nr:DUF4416 family protein [Planctomycetota bacterium]
MGTPRPPTAVLLLVGMLAAEERVLDAAEASLIGAFGPIAGRSPTWPFTFTRYYEREMGPALLRRFVDFSAPFDPGRLADAKLATQRIEAEFAARAGGGAPGASAAVTPPPRPLNLDPGCLSLGKLVLASTKDHAHRIYLRDGIYAEVTLFFRDGAFRTLPWTYPDYGSGLYMNYLMEARERARGGYAGHQARHQSS